jgi:ribosomal protein S18 acetylase RimI-like enzyme
VTIQLSAIDEERFGIRSARVTGVKLDELASISEFCHVNAVRFLVVRCSAYDLSTVQAMEQQGFLLMDTLVYFSRSLTVPIPSCETALRPVADDEAEIVSELAAEAFKDYGGHYYADHRLDRAKCDEVYSSWAYRSCVSRQVADEVLVAEWEGTIAGFITLKFNDPQEGEVPLYGVSPRLQRHGIGQTLICGALEWFQAKGCERMVTSTQVTNLRSQKVWIRLGFEPSDIFYTFHKWFD